VCIVRDVSFLRDLMTVDLSLVVRGDIEVQLSDFQTGGYTVSGP